MTTSDTIGPRKSRRPSVRLDRDEAWEVVRAAHTGIFTSLRRDGSPIATPVWFVVEDRIIWITTPRGTKKVTRSMRDARSSFLVESGERWSTLRAVHMVCAVTVVDDRATLGRIETLKAEKYKGFRRTERSELPTDTQNYYAARRVALRLEPENHIVSWDNARISP